MGSYDSSFTEKKRKITMIAVGSHVGYWLVKEKKFETLFSPEIINRVSRVMIKENKYFSNLSKNINRVIYVHKNSTFTLAGWKWWESKP